MSRMIYTKYDCSKNNKSRDERLYNEVSKKHQQFCSGPNINV